LFFLIETSKSVTQLSSSSSSSSFYRLTPVLPEVKEGWL
jgi:hypothetical protein